MFTSEELRKEAVEICLSDLRKVLSETCETSISDPALKIGYESGYAAAIEKVSWYVSRLEKYLEV